MLKVLILCGGSSSEHEVSLVSGEMVLRNLDKKKYITEKYVIEKKGVNISRLIAKIKKTDFVFIAMHGAFGEDGRIQAFLEWIGIPYSGSNVASSAMAMDKNIANTLYIANGLCVPK